MKPLFPWLRVFWEELSEAEQEEFQRKAKLITRTIKIDAVRVTALAVLKELIDQYSVIAADCESTYLAIKDHQSDAVPVPAIERVYSYFSHFPQD